MHCIILIYVYKYICIYYIYIYFIYIYMYIYIYIYIYLKCTHQDVSSGVSLDAEMEPYQKLLTRLNSLKYIHCFISQNLGPL